MRVTLDTNVLIAAFVSHGVCHDLFEYLARHHTVLSSALILEEFERVLLEKMRISERLVKDAIKLLGTRLVLVDVVSPATVRLKDQDDKWVLATAVAGDSHCTIAGDKALQNLGSFEGIPIVKPVDFFSFEAGRRQGSGTKPI